MTDRHRDHAAVHGLTDAEVAAWADRSRAASGLGPTVEDPVVLTRIATLAFAGLDAQNATTPRSCRTPRRRTDHSAGQQEGQSNGKP